MPVNGRSWGFDVSEGLEPRSWWYIPESGIYHHSKLTRKGPAGPASNRPGEDAKVATARTRVPTAVASDATVAHSVTVIAAF